METGVDFAVEVGEEALALFVPIFHEAEGFADDFAGGVIAAGFDLAEDELFEGGGEVDVHLM